MLSRALLTTSLSLTACATLPPAPRHVQYGAYAQVEPPGFYGVDSETKARVYRRFDDPVMRGAQCLTTTDYRAWAQWVEAVKQIAKDKCK